MKASGIPYMEGVSRRSTEARCQAIANLLLQEGVTEMKRNDFDALLAQGFGLGASSVANIGRSGELLGYWKRGPAIARKGRNGLCPGTVEIMAQASNPEPLEAPLPS